MRGTGVARVVGHHGEDHQRNVQAIGGAAGQGERRILFVSETYRGEVEDEAVVWRRRRRGGSRVIVVVVVRRRRCRRRRSGDLAGW